MYPVIRKGERQDGTYWAQLKKEVDGFIVTAFINTVEPVEQEELEVPSSIELQWQA